MAQDFPSLDNRVQTSGHLLVTEYNCIANRVFLVRCNTQTVFGARMGPYAIDTAANRLWGLGVWWSGQEKCI